MLKSYSLLLFFLVVFIASNQISCTTSNDINSNLQGKWMLYKAFRNNRPTLTLEKTYFKFWSNDSLETNFTGIVEKAKYSINKNIINSGSTLPQFIVNKISNDTLFLETKINNYLFSLTLFNIDEK